MTAGVPAGEATGVPAGGTTPPPGSGRGAVRRALGLAVAAWLTVVPVGLGAQGAQEARDRGTALSSTVPFRLEEPRPNPFQDRVEIPFVLGEGPPPGGSARALGEPTGEAGRARPADRPGRATVSIRVYNVLHQRVAWAEVAPGEDRSGRRVRELAYGVPGVYRAVWDGRGDDGHRVVSGPYFVEIVVDGWTAVRKVLLTR